MAVDISSNYVKEFTKGPTQTFLKYVIKASPYTKKYRNFMRRLMKNKINESTTDCEITSALDAGAAHFQEHGWVFVKDVFSKDFHDELIKNWPKRYYFTPPKKLTKGYDVGFPWAYGQENDPEYIYQYPTIKKFLHYLRSQDFERRMSDFVGRDMPFASYSLVMHTSYPGTQVVPHKDGVYENENTKNFLNILFFINGTGGKNSGGLTLSRDNELKDVIVEPTELVNTALIYDSKADFYHGFKPIQFGKFRWAAGAQFCEQGFIDKISQ